jgi:hypothetical protein
MPPHRPRSERGIAAWEAKAGKQWAAVDRDSWNPCWARDGLDPSFFQIAQYPARQKSRLRVGSGSD